MVNVAFQLGNQVNEDLEYSPKVSSIAYDSLLIMGMGGSGVAGDVLSLLSSEVSSKNIIVRKTYSIPKKHWKRDHFVYLFHIQEIQKKPYQDWKKQ